MADKTYPAPPADESLWVSRKSLHDPAEGQGGGVNRHRGAKQAANAGMTASSVGNTAAQYATGVGAYAMATGAVAVSATGIGLVAVGGALTIGSMVQAGRSWSKTSDHIKGLNDIMRNKRAYRCAACAGGQESKIAHDYIADTVLAYVVDQKTKKLTRKKVSTFGGGALVGIYEKTHGLVKAIQGTRGKARSHYANILAVHLVTHKCQLAEAIVSQLYSAEECRSIRLMNSGAAGTLLMDKMKSG